MRLVGELMGHGGELGEIQFAGRPQISAMPKTMNEEDSAPRIRYFTPASSDWSTVALKTDEHVKRDGDEFDGHEQHREVVGRGGEQHAGQREQNQRIIFRHAAGGERSENSAAMNNTKIAATIKKRLKNRDRRVVDEHAVERGAELAATTIAAQARDQQQRPARRWRRNR
jgi:hypothetical protein